MLSSAETDGTFCAKDANRRTVAKEKNVAPAIYS